MEKLGKYVLLEKLTTGGMAEVFRAVSTGPGGFKRIVAIKKILPCYADSPEFQRMFTDEASIAARLSHASIAQVYDFDIVDGTPYIAMEFVEGKDLTSMLQECARRGEQISFAIAVAITLEVAKGLYYVHSRREQSRPLNIVHRDVSPQNIMVSHAGEVKLVDFGIAKAAQRQAATRVGTVKGKYSYMSPEQVMGEAVDHRTDVFSLGVVLWEMLTLQRLFAGESEGETISNLLKKKIPAPHVVRPDVPAQLSPLVLRALKRDRAERYPSMLAMYEALSRFLFDTGSYPDMSAISAFIRGLFPEEMERLAQGEHLVFDGPGTKNQRPPREDEREEDGEEEDEEDGEDEENVEDEEEVDEEEERTETESTGYLARGWQNIEEKGGRGGDGGRKRGKGVAVGLGVALVLLIVLFGLQVRDVLAPPAPDAQEESVEGERKREKEKVESRKLVAPGAALSEAQKAESNGASVEGEGRREKGRKKGEGKRENEKVESGKLVGQVAVPLAISIHTDPADAKILIGETLFSSGRIELDREPGEVVTVKVSRGGYAEVNDSFAIFDGLERKYELHAPSFLEIFVEPVDSVVKVDGDELLRTGREGHYVYEGALHQTVELRVSRWGYHAQREKLTLGEDENKTLVRLKSRVAASEMDKKESWGHLQVIARPYGKVTVNGQLWGNSISNEKRRVSTGEYKVEIENPAYEKSVVTCTKSVTEGYTPKCYHDFDEAEKAEK